MGCHQFDLVVGLLNSGANKLALFGIHAEWFFEIRRMGEINIRDNHVWDFSF